jgi:hypothetical protein
MKKRVKTFDVTFNTDLAGNIRVRARSERAAVKHVKALWSESSDSERRQRFKFNNLETTMEFCEATEVRS